MKKRLKTGLIFGVLLSVLGLCSCASTNSMPDAPCDNFGQHCDPKMPINHR